MIDEGEKPIIDFVKRSDDEQNRLFKEGKSKCDGYKIRSAHQDGKAADIYFIDQNQLVPPKKGYDYWHEIWQDLMDGKPIIQWDQGHFE